MADDLSCSISNPEYMRSLEETASSATEAAQGELTCSNDGTAKPAPAGDNQAVKALVDRFSRPDVAVYLETTASAPMPPPASFGTALKHCTSNLLSTGLGVGGAALTLGGAPLVGLAAIGIGGYALGGCVSRDMDAQRAARDIAEAAQTCRDAGGIPTGVINGTVTCLLPAGRGR